MFKMEIFLAHQVLDEKHGFFNSMIFVDFFRSSAKLQPQPLLAEPSLILHFFHAPTCQYILSYPSFLLKPQLDEKLTMIDSFKLVNR